MIYFVNTGSGGRLTEKALHRKHASVICCDKKKGGGLSSPR